MNKQEILTKIYNDVEYNQVICNICKDKKHFCDDLKQEIFLSLMEKKDDLIINLYNDNKLKFYFIRMVMNQIHSTQSTFYRKYRKAEAKYEVDNELVEDFLCDDIIIDIKPFSFDFDIYNYIISKQILDWNQVELFNLYYRINPSFLEEDISVKMSYSIIADKLEVSKPNIAQQITLIQYKVFKHILSDKDLSEVINFKYLKSFVKKYELQNKKSKLCKQLN